MIDFSLVVQIITITCIVGLSVLLGIILGAYVATTVATTLEIKLSPITQKVLVFITAALAGSFGLLLGLRWTGPLP